MSVEIDTKENDEKITYLVNYSNGNLMLKVVYNKKHTDLHFFHYVVEYFEFYDLEGNKRNIKKHCIIDNWDTPDELICGINIICKNSTWDYIFFTNLDELLDAILSYIIYDVYPETIIGDEFDFSEVESLMILFNSMKSKVGECDIDDIVTELNNNILEFSEREREYVNFNEFKKIKTNELFWIYGYPHVLIPFTDDNFSDIIYGSQYLLYIAIEESYYSFRLPRRENWTLFSSYTDFINFLLSAKKYKGQFIQVQRGVIVGGEAVCEIIYPNTGASLKSCNI